MSTNRPLRFLLLGAVNAASLPLAMAQTTWTHFDRCAGACATSFGLGLSNMCVLRFGGEDPSSGELTAALYRFQGNAWHEQATLTRPAARTDAAIAAVNLPVGPRALLFGGRTANGAVGDAWSFDGSDWSLLAPPIAPPARYEHAMVADTRRGRFVLFGGRDGSVELGDTWEFDPSTGTWLQLAVGLTAPTARHGHAMAFDPTADHGNTEIVLFGGFDGTADLGDTWYFQLGNWTAVNTGAAAPSPRRAARLAFHPGSSTNVLFGGIAGGVPSNETWTYDGATNGWALRSTPIGLQPPPARSAQAMHFDPLTLDVVMACGRSAAGAAPAGTWRWNNFGWIASATVPVRDGAALAARPTDDSLVMFGGATAGGFLADTWELHDSAWTDRSPAFSPSARADAGLVHDTFHDATVLFGGRNAGGLLGDTWAWANGAWQQLLPNGGSGPGGAAFVQPSFDVQRSTIWLPNGVDMWRLDIAPGVANWTRQPSIAPRATVGCLHGSRVVTFGGDDGNGVLGDSWIWDGTAWRPNSSNAPAPRHNHSLVHDTVRGLTYLFNGHNGGPGGNQLRSEFWSFDGQSWQRLADRSGAERTATAFDAQRGVVVNWGGLGGTNADVDEFDGTLWRAIHINGAQQRPSLLIGAAMTFDGVHGYSLMFGGATSTGPVVSQTWTWNGTAWTQRTPTTAPPARSDAGICFDASSGRVLLFGGYDGSGNGRNDLWSWDGTNWAAVPGSATGAPSARGQAVVTPTLSGAGCLVFGGRANATSGTFFDDLWRWDGSQWRAEYLAPAARTECGAAYDALRHRVVLFGGSAAAGVGPYFQDTFEWDADAWIRRTPAHSPPARARCRLAYDASRDRTVMIGGNDATTTFTDSWEWDGTDWAQRLPVSPGPAADSAVAYDQLRRATVAIGTGGMLEYGPVHRATRLQFAPPCTTHITPRLVFPDPAGPWLGATWAIEESPAPTGSLGYLAIGFTRLPAGLPIPFIPGCQLHTVIDLDYLIVPSVTGSLHLDLPVPDLPYLLGLAVYLQGGLLDGAAWGVTDAVQCEVGSR